MGRQRVVASILCPILIICSAWVSVCDLCPYEEWKAKYTVPNKRKGFAEAIFEIEKDLSLKLSSSGLKVLRKRTRNNVPLPPIDKPSVSNDQSPAISKPPSPPVEKGPPPPDAPQEGGGVPQENAPPLSAEKPPPLPVRVTNTTTDIIYDMDKLQSSTVSCSPTKSLLTGRTSLAQGTEKLPSEAPGPSSVDKQSGLTADSNDACTQCVSFGDDGKSLPDMPQPDKPLDNKALLTDDKAVEKPVKLLVDKPDKPVEKLVDKPDRPVDSPPTDKPVPASSTASQASNINKDHLLPVEPTPAPPQRHRPEGALWMAMHAAAGGKQPTGEPHTSAKEDVPSKLTLPVELSQRPALRSSSRQPTGGEDVPSKLTLPVELSQRPALRSSSRQPTGGEDVPSKLTLPVELSQRPALRSSSRQPTGGGDLHAPLTAATPPARDGSCNLSLPNSVVSLHVLCRNNFVCGILF